MGLFRGKKSRQVVSEPPPDWDDTRWRSHLRSNTLGTEHHCALYLEMIDADRKEAARTFKNDDEIRARSIAESAIRNKRIVTALTALAPLSGALHERSEPLGGYTSLAQIPEPARSSIVTIVYAAGRLPMSYLTDTVNFLREQFGSVHIDHIHQGGSDLDTLVNPTVREALSPGPASSEEVDDELAAAVKEYFGISVQPSVARSRTPPLNAGPAASGPYTDPPAERPRPPQPPPPHQAPPPALPAGDMRRAQTTPISSVQSSDAANPMSPQLNSDYRGAPPARPVPPFDPQSPPLPPAPTPPLSAAGLSPRGRMFTPSAPPSRYTPTSQPPGPEVLMSPTSPRSPALVPSGLNVVDIGAMKRGRTMPVAPMSPEQRQTFGERDTYASLSPVPAARMASRTRDQESPRLQTRAEGQRREVAAHLKSFSDSDDMLLARYEHLRQVLSV